MAKKRLQTKEQREEALDRLRASVDALDEQMMGETLTAQDWQKIIALLMELIQLAAQLASGAGARG